MRDLPRNPDLVVETGKHGGIFCGGFRQKLKRNGLAEAQIVGTIDFAHAAFAEPSENSVPLGQQRTWNKASFIEIRGVRGGSDGNRQGRRGGCGVRLDSAATGKTKA